MVFLSYDEPLADVLCARLGAVWGVPVKRLHGVRGMARAYELTAHVATTGQYLLADGDFEVDPGFTLDRVAPLAEGESMRVWQARNAVNGLVYGYGGLKLCRRSAMTCLGRGRAAVDVLAALPGRVRFVPEVAGATRIDQSARHAWRAGFRECAMLTRGCEYGGTTTGQSRLRLAAWTGPGHGEHAEHARAGARAGIAFAAATPADSERWQLLNDPAWLDQRHAADLDTGPVATGWSR
ncbi:hypothetical protein LV78_003550 [Actinosynnema pretiosum]|nr:hypothetical protein [Actinosynnema pretiosum]